MKRLRRMKTDNEIQIDSDKEFGNYIFRGIIETSPSRKALFECKLHKTKESQLLSSHFRGSHCCEECKQIRIRDNKLKKVRLKIKKKFGNKITVDKNLGNGIYIFKCIEHTSYEKAIGQVLKSQSGCCTDCSNLLNSEISRKSLKECNDAVNNNPRLKGKFVASEIFYKPRDEGKSEVRMTCLDHVNETKIFQTIGAVGKKRPTCPSCTIENTSNRKKDTTIEKEISELVAKFYLNYEVENWGRLLIKNRFDVYVNLKCPHNFYFHIDLPHMRRGQTKCDKCRSNKIIESKLKYSYDDFIFQGSEINHNKYNYTLNPIFLNKAEAYFKSTSKIFVGCKEHGGFITTYRRHILNRSGHCPNCIGWENEKRIRSYLEKNNFKFEEQYSYNNCRGKKQPLLFDFFIPSYNLLIEYDGEQHFREVEFFHKTRDQFKMRLKYDDNKNKFAKQEKINILRIPYTKKNEMEELINDALNKINKGESVYTINEDLRIL